MPYGPAGPAVYEHPLSSANVGAYQIATDSTGAGMVVTEGAVGKIGVYTSNGTVEYATGAANSSPAGIVWNSGGYYFVDSGANAIGSFNPYNNTITEYPVPSSGAAPSRIAISGETWQVWFTEPGVSKVGYFNDPTKISELPCSGVPAQIITGQFETAVLTTSGDIDVYDNATGSYVVMHPPASTNGPVVGMGQRGDGDAVLLRSNGTSTALQDLFYY
jgi:streptogramin lyase